MDRFSQDILSEILLRLPATSLATAACHVCKRWRATVVDPFFYKAHLARSLASRTPTFLLRLPTPDDGGGDHKPSRKTELFHLTIDEIFALDLDSPPTNLAPFCSDLPVISVRIASSLHGLLLLDDTRKYNHRYHICNPVLRSSVELPPIAESEAIMSLGFDPVCNAYKVVRISMYTFEMNVFEIGQPRRQWTSLGKAPYRGLRFFHGQHGIYLDGKLHWLAYTLKHDIDHDSEPAVFIVSLDLHGYSFRILHGPLELEGKMMVFHSVQSNRVFYRMHSLGGRLGLSGAQKEEELEVWVMEVYGNRESWVMKHCIPLEGQNPMVSPRCYWREGEILLCLDGRDGHELISCDLETNVVGDVVNPRRKTTEGISHYVPSIVPLGTRQREPMRKRRSWSGDGV